MAPTPVQSKWATTHPVLLASSHNRGSYSAVWAGSAKGITRFEHIRRQAAVLFHFRPSTGGFCCPLPEGIGSPRAGLFQIKPVGKSSESRFKAVSTSGVSLWCCGCHEGICGRCWRLSEAFQREVRGLVPAQLCFGWGVVDGAITVYHGTRKPVEEEVIQGGVVAGARFRISPEQGAAAWWGEISCLPDHPGGPQVFSLELSARRSRGPDPSSLVALVLRAGFLKKKFPFFPKRLLGYWDHLFFGFCSNNSYLKSDHY